MFRWLFFILLAANLFPFLFASNDDRAVGQSPPPGEPAAYGVKSVTLLGEQQPGAASPNPPEPSGAGLPQRRELRCFLLGPLESMAVAESYAGVLEERGLDIRRRWREVAVGSDYWVYLPKLPSSRATTRTLQELKASNIEGFIFSEGELKGAVAVAVYTSEKAAAERMSDLADIGYDARIHQMDRLAREYWLSSEVVPGPGVMMELMNSANEGDIPQKISRRDCKTVASAMRFQ